MAEFCLCLDLLSESPKILFRKIKKGLYLKQEKGLWLCSVSVKQNEKPCIDGLLSVNQALCHLLIFP